MKSSMSRLYGKLPILEKLARLNIGSSYSDTCPMGPFSNVIKRDMSVGSCVPIGLPVFYDYVFDWK